MTESNPMLRPPRVGLGLALCGLLSAPAQAAWLVEPSLELTSGYEDNVRLNPDEEVDAVVSTAAAQARFRNVTEVSEVAGLVGASYLNYSSTDDEALDDEDTQFLSLLARRDGERSRFGVQLDGRRSLILRRMGPIPDLLDGLQDDPADAGEDEPVGGGQDLDEPVGDDDIDLNATPEQVRRTNVRAEPFFEYQLGRLTNMRLSYEYTERWFDDEGEIEGLRDTRTQGVSLGLGRMFTPRTRWGLSVGAARFTADEVEGSDQEVDNFTAAVGFDHQLSEQVSFGAEVGASRSEREATNEEDTHVTYRVRLARDMPVSRLSAHVERSSQPSAYGGVVAADRLSVRYQRSIHERLEFGLTMYGYRTERLGDSGRDLDDRTYASVEPRLTWRLTEAWNAGVAYRYRWTDRDSDAEFGGTADSNFASLFLSYQPLRRL